MKDWWLVKFRRIGRSSVFTYWFYNYSRLEDFMIKGEESGKLKILAWHHTSGNGKKDRK